MSDNITREPYRNAWYKQLADAVKKHDEEIAEMTPHLVPEVEESDNGKILIAGEDGAFDWGQPPEELPIITEGDEGKVLKVDEGVPKWLTDNDSEFLIVTVTRSGEGTEQSPYTFTADKDYNTVREYALNSKVFAVFDNRFYIIDNITSNQVNFYSLTPSTSTEDLLQYDTYNRQYYYLLHNITKYVISIRPDKILFFSMFIYNGDRYRLTLANNANITDIEAKTLNILREHYTVGTIVNNEFILLKLVKYTSTSGNASTYDFTNEAYGIKAHIASDKSVTITKTPKLPATTSADEGKVVMVDSNGDYVLGTVSGNSYPIPFSVETVNITAE